MALKFRNPLAMMGLALMVTSSVTTVGRSQVAPPAGAAMYAQDNLIPPPAANPAGAGNGPGSNSSSSYPAAEVQVVPIARARLATARAEQNQMLNDLHSTVDRLHEDLNSSPEMIAAVHEEREAYLAYDDARRKVLVKLSEDPTYRAMVSLVASLKQKLDDEHPSAKPSDEQTERLEATAALKLSYASTASAMESAALAADSDVQSTHGRLLAAGSKTAELRADFERKVRRAPEFLAARRGLDEARINHITAEAFFDGALEARDIALNYAYYLHRFDQYSYSPSVYTPTVYSNYNPYQYGYGYRRY